ncbi:MarR family winged helix-turn-helix transcriptional regulator [Streptomyces sporangiiformans]|uniref:MarR family transcriptional regulator n=1 Tax=Streptomyces sporangiiformans TaxID=2315329 RepID=A0A505D4B7_9ACTN|nr:MarR family transcriptional regulator [Streptomyces sporangiiformans]TPQ16495.1 MarR family transcriptional regulator [Streptomyces sporangiiformans]
MNATPRQSDKAAARAANSQLVRDFGLLIKSATRLEQRIDSALRRECGISHTMLEVLIRLCRQPGEEVSQRQLADDLTLTSSGTTRLIDRMEEAGLVRRLPSPEDRRVALVEPTDEGRAVFLRAAPVHARVVEECFVKPVAPDDYARLTSALSEIHQALGEDAG